VRKNAREYIYVYIGIQICMYIYIYIHTCVHTHTPLLTDARLEGGGGESGPTRESRTKESFLFSAFVSNSNSRLISISPA